MTTAMRRRGERDDRARIRMYTATKETTATREFVLGALRFDAR